MQKIIFTGLGYIGLPTATVVAGKGLEVLGVDINEWVVDTINRGNIPLFQNVFF
jgi:UDP-N-acetyl-D-mannosaminuronic acid dehydrogenase